ncbi:MAG TPA: hypothetical protein VE242_08195, partial [Chthoniobacterales bacterium]|nr:hypothetical protein [Chthoniobacterales bacterium]
SSYQKHCTESSVNIVNVVTQTYDLYSSFESIDHCKALGVTLTINDQQIRLEIFILHPSLSVEGLLSQ